MLIFAFYRGSTAIFSDEMTVIFSENCQPPSCRPQMGPVNIAIRVFHLGSSSGLTNISFWHCDDIIMKATHLKSPSCRLFAQPFIQAQIKEKLAFVRRIRRWPVHSPHKRPVTWKCFHLMISSGMEHVLPWKRYVVSILLDRGPRIGTRNFGSNNVSSWWHLFCWTYVTRTLLLYQSNADTWVMLKIMAYRSPPFLDTGCPVPHIGNDYILWGEWCMHAWGEWCFCMHPSPNDDSVHGVYFRAKC